MRAPTIACLFVLALGLVSCTTAPPREKPRPVVTVEPPSKADEWKRIATAEDQSRLERVGLAWQSALA